MAYVYALDPTDPLDTGLVSDGANELRTLKAAVLERLDTIIADTTADPYTFRPLVVTGGTITVSTPVLVATQTWNAIGVVFTGIKLNVTNTASASGSLLLDLQVGGTSQFKVDKAGNTTLVSGSMLAAQAVTATTLVTSSTINGQTISASAALTGTLSVASGLTVTAGGILVSAGTSVLQAVTATSAVVSGPVNFATDARVYTGSATTTVYSLSNVSDSQYLAIAHDNGSGAFAMSVVVVNATGTISSIATLASAGGLAWGASGLNLQITNSGVSLNGRSSLIRIR